MADTGLVFAGAGASIAITPQNGLTWTSPGNITADDTSYASITSSSFDTDVYSYVLYSDQFNFSAVPDTATITGIEVVFAAYYAVNGADLTYAYLNGTTANTAIGTDQTGTCSPSVSMTNSMSEYTLGSSANLWGNESIAVATIKDADFGVQLGFQATGNNCDLFVDYVEMRVYYTLPDATATPSLVSGTLSTLAPTITATNPAADALVQPDIVVGYVSAATEASVTSEVLNVMAPIDGTGTAIGATVDLAQPVSITVYPSVIAGVFSAISNAVQAAATVVTNIVQGLFSPVTAAIAASALVVISPVAAIASPISPAIVTTTSVSTDATLVSGTLSILEPAVTTTASVTVDADIVTGAFSTYDSFVAVAKDETVEPDIVTGLLTAINPQVSTTVSITADAELITGILSVSDPAITGEASAVAGLVSGTLSAIEPSVSASISTTVEADLVAGALGVLSVTVQSGGNVTVVTDIISGTFGLVTPTAQGDAVVIASVVSGTLETIAPAIEATTSLTASADLVSGTLSVLDPSVEIDIAAAASLVSGTFETIAPSIIATEAGDATPQADLVEGAFSVYDPSVNIEDAGIKVVYPDVVVGYLSAPQEVGVVSEVLNVLDPVVGYLTANPAGIQSPDALVVVDIITGYLTTLQEHAAQTANVTVIPEPVGGTFYVADQMDVDTINVFDVELVSGTLSVPAPFVAVVSSGSALVQPSVITGTFSLPTPTWRQNKIVSVGVVAGTFSPVEVAGFDHKVVQVSVISGRFSTIAPTTDLQGDRIVAAELVTGRFNARNPNIYTELVKKIYVKVKGKWIQIV